MEELNPRWLSIELNDVSREIDDTKLILNGPLPEGSVGTNRSVHAATESHFATDEQAKAARTNLRNV
jgi:hypothetical protein